MTEIPLLTFDKLFELVEENQFQSETDKKIAVKIIEAERDWGDSKTSFNTLNEFILELEKEVDGIVTKSSLNELLNKYTRNINQNAWKIESVSYLLDIFDLIEETELRNIFNKLTEKVKAE